MSRIFHGSVPPEGVHVGRPGDIYNEIANGQFIRQWVKVSGEDTNTGWE